jgi:hypothetical protein
MDKEKGGLAGTIARANVRGIQVRARASHLVDAAAERGRRVYDGAVNEAAGALSSASDTVDAVGKRAHSTGEAIRKGSKRTARAITRGEKNLRDSDPREIADAAASAVRRHRFAFAAAGAAVLAFITMKIMRRTNGVAD